MSNEDFNWRKELCIGIEHIDKAHEELFSIVRKLNRLIEDDKNEFASVQGIKYLKSYVIRHFEEEEEYMRSISYEGYEKHKLLHARLRDNTLPALEQDMEANNYSPQSVKRFLDICIRWLNEHIKIEDMNIGKSQKKV
ncbi:MAG: hemerythrin family protein [Desulfovibrionaceae bacterium]|nr:hemerythrin family protein [Desulfovibrionaceae bacterium]